MPYVLRAMVFNRLGEHERARQICLEGIKYVPESDQRYTMLYGHLDYTLAFSEAGVGDTEGAARRLDGLIASLARHRNPSGMFRLNEVRARVTLMTGDDRTFEHHLKQMRYWAQHTRNPALLSHCERFADQGEKAGVRIAATPMLDDGEEVATAISAPRVDDIVKRVMAECELWQERAQRALHMIIEQARGTAGYIYLLRDDEFVMAAAEGRAQAPDGLAHRVLQFIESGGVEDEETSQSEMRMSTETTYGDPTADGGRNKWSYRLMLLNAPQAGRSRTIGAVALAVGEDPLAHLKSELLEAIAAYL
jgi:hypothetical protein